MDTTSAMRRMVEESGLTHAQLERRAGQYGGWVGQSLARPRPGADVLAALARACGYRLALVPIAGGTSIVIGDDTQSDEDAPTIDQARQLMARSLAVLDQLADQERTD